MAPSATLFASVLEIMESDTMLGHHCQEVRIVWRFSRRRAKGYLLQTAASFLPRSATAPGSAKDEWTLISVGARQVEEQKGDSLGIASAEGDQDLGTQVRRHRSSLWEIVACAKQLSPCLL